MTFKPEELIISKPELLWTKRKVGSFFTLILFWATFLYMLRPVIVLIGWLISIHVLKETVSLNHVQAAMIEPVGEFMYFLILMLIVFPAWMIYNKARFSGANDRRSQAEHRTVNEDMPAKMNISSELYEKAVSSRTMVCYFDEDSNIIDIQDLIVVFKEQADDELDEARPFVDEAMFGEIAPA
jgi:poly-beta-1,6-N-acetyl-D-glucosamine biosynthesis protein PgaD